MRSYLDFSGFFGYSCVLRTKQTRRDSPIGVARKQIRRMLLSFSGAEQLEHAEPVTLGGT